jgi:hypothetical protein
MLVGFVACVAGESTTRMDALLLFLPMLLVVCLAFPRLCPNALSGQAEICGATTFMCYKFILPWSPALKFRSPWSRVTKP